MYNKYCGIEVNSKKRVREGIYAHIYENRETYMESRYIVRREIKSSLFFFFFIFFYFFYDDVTQNA